MKPIFISDQEAPYYTNSCLPSVEYQGDFIKLTQCGDKLTRYCSGGVVVHYYTPDVPSKKAFETFIKKLSKTRIPYFTITRVVSYCSSCNQAYDDGNLEKCPSCNSKLDYISRVVGYSRPLSNWNLAKKCEWSKRKLVKIEE